MVGTSIEDYVTLDTDRVTINSEILKVSTNNVTVLLTSVKLILFV